MDLNTLVIPEQTNATCENENMSDNGIILGEKMFVKKQYDYDKKIELVKKINKIKKKEYLINIFRIIVATSKDYTENNNGVFVFFHNLSDDTYEQIESYVNKIYKTHKKSSSLLSVYSDLSDSQNFYSDTIEIKKNNDANNNLSNKEKIIMKRKKYEKYLDQNQEK